MESETIMIGFVIICAPRDPNNDNSVINNALNYKGGDYLIVVSNFLLPSFLF